MKTFAWCKWALVVLLGFIVWQFVINSTFIFVQIVRFLNLEEALFPWIHTFSALIGLVFVLTGLHFVYRWPGNGLKSLGWTTEYFLRDALLGLGAGLLKTAIVLFVFIPLVRDNAEILLEPARALSSSPLAIINGLVLMIIYGGIVEEVFFRGHIITSVRNALGNQTWSVAVAVLLSVILFATAHTSYSPLAMGVVAAGGLLFSVLYLWTGRLTASMFAHGSYDVATFAGIYFLYPPGSVG